MTITLAQNAARVSYSVSEGATQTSFTVSFEFFDAADLNVYVDGTLKTISTHYTVSGGSGSTGAVAISVTGASGGSTVVITRSIALARTTDFPTSGSFQIATLNTELDRFTAIAADLKDSVDRSLQLTDFDSAVSLVLPAVADRKGKVLAFNASTGAVEAGASVSAVQSVADNAAAVNLLGTAAVVEDMGLLATSAVIEDMGLLATSAVIQDMGLLATSTVIADMAILATTDIVADMAILATTDVVADMNTLATSDIISDLNTLATSDIVTDMNLLATSANVAAMGKLGVDAVIADMALLGTDAVVADLEILGTTDVVADMNTLATSDIVSDMNTLATSANVTAMGLLGTSTVLTDMALLGTSAVIEDMGLLATSAVIEDMGLLATAAVIEDMGQLANSTVLSNIATLAADNSPSISAITVGGASQLNGTLTVGANDQGYDVTLHGDTAARNVVWDSSADSLIFSDNAKAVFGAGPDLAIYHDGTNSLIDDTDSGFIAIRSDTSVKLLKRTGNENMVVAVPDGAVTLYHNNAAKIATTATGAAITGAVKPTTYQETYVAASAASTVTLNLSTATNFSITLGQATTFAFSNPPSTGTAYSFTLIITQHSTAVSITWPSSVDWAGGSAPDAALANEVQAYGFITRDGGTTYYGFLGGTAIG